MQELDIVLNQDNDRFLYLQIYEHIRDEIRGGRIGAGERLPATRALAEELDVARTTVQMAYEQLLSEGYVESRGNRGYFALMVGDLYDLKARQESAGTPGGSTLAKAPHKEEQAEKILYDFSPRTIDMSRFPYATWNKIAREVMRGDDPSLFISGEGNGEPEFRQTIARYLYFSRGIVCRPENLVIGAGNDYLLMLLRTLLAPAQKVGMEFVTYPRAAAIFRSFGYEVRALRTGGQGMDPAALEESDCSLVYCMPAHQYPMGSAMPVSTRSRILSWAENAPERYIIEDDYDSAFRYRGRPIPSLQASDRSGRVIYIGTFSKSIAPSIRVSYMVLPPALAEKYHAEMNIFSSTVSRIDQRILNSFIDSGSFERYLNRMRISYRAKHDYLVKELRKFAHFSLRGEGAGLHLLLEETGMRENDGSTAGGAFAASAERERQLVQLAARAGVRVYPLSAFLIEEKPPEGQDYRPTVLLGFASLSMEELAEGVKRLRETFEKENL